MNLIETLQAALEGDSKAMHALVEAIKTSTVKITDKIINEFNEIIDNKINSDAIFLRGYQFEVGFGVAKNIEWAIAHYKEAIELKNSSAMNSLALIYMDKSLPNLLNYSKGIELLQRAVALKNTAAMNNLGLYYSNKELPIFNLETAIGFFNDAIALGNPYAMYNRALLYLRGEDSHLDKQKAAKLLRQACKASDITSNLADLSYKTLTELKQANSNAMFVAVMWDEDQDVSIFRNQEFLIAYQCALAEQDPLPSLKSLFNESPATTISLVFKDELLNDKEKKALLTELINKTFSSSKNASDLKEIIKIIMTAAKSNLLLINALEEIINTARRVCDINITTYIELKQALKKDTLGPETEDETHLLSTEAKKLKAKWDTYPDKKQTIFEEIKNRAEHNIYVKVLLADIYAANMLPQSIFSQVLSPYNSFFNQFGLKGTNSSDSSNEIAKSLYNEIKIYKKEYPQNENISNGNKSAEQSQSIDSIPEAPVFSSEKQVKNIPTTTKKEKGQPSSSKQYPGRFMGELTQVIEKRNKQNPSIKVVVPTIKNISNKSESPILKARQALKPTQSAMFKKDVEPTDKKDTSRSVITNNGPK